MAASCRSHLLHALHVLHAGDLAHAGDDALKVLEVCYVDNHVDCGMTLGGLGFDIADVGVGVADDGGDLLQHTGTIITEDDELDGEAGLPDGCGANAAIFSPLYGNAAFGLVHEILNVFAGLGVNSYAFAARNVTDDFFAADGVAASRAVDEEIVVSFDLDRGIVAAKNAAHDAGESPGSVFRLRGIFGTGAAAGRQTRQD